MALVCASLCISCGDSESERLESEVDLPMNFVADIEPFKTSEGEVSSLSNNNDKVVAISVDNAVNHYKYIIGEGNKMIPESSSNMLYWLKSTYTRYIQAWYPVNFVVGNSSADGKINIADQSDGYEKVDLIYALHERVVFKAGVQEMPLKFEHRMAKVTVKVEKSEEVEGDVHVWLMGYTSGSFDIVKNELKDLPDSNEMITPKKNDDGSFTAVLIPQDMTDKDIMLVTTDDGKFPAKIEGEVVEYKAGHSYIYKAVVKPTELKLYLESTTEWSQGEDITGGIEEVN